jgi:hypothetical protein
MLFDTDSIQLTQHLTKEVLEGFGDFKIGQVIRTVKYADDLVLLAKEEALLQDMIDRLIEIRRGNVMEVNVENTKVMRISRQPSPLRIMIDKIHWPIPVAARSKV